MRSSLVASLLVSALSPVVSAQEAASVPVRVTVDAAQITHAVSPTLHGVFFEDINYGADGGLYAELVQNRSFEHAEREYAWGRVNRGGDGDFSIETARPIHAKNPHYAHLTVRDPGKGFGFANYGYGGIVVRTGETYLVSLRVRGKFQAASGNAAPLQAVLEDETGRPLGACRLEGVTPEWTKLEGSITATGPTTQGRLVVLVGSAGEVDCDVVSLFPAHTFHDRRNGVRADLAQMLADLKPGFIRFPGGCIVEGMDLPNRYQWKDSIGDIAERPENWNRWQDAIRNQTAPQYYQTYGLGFFEYFQLCEDLGCAPVPILNCGMACQYQSKQLVPLDQLDPYVQDALDLIEFANGPATSPWGARRAAMGHPEPFGLKYLGVGNEQWGEDYFARYAVFQAALKAKHPEVQLISTSGPGVDDASWKLAWDKFHTGTPADIVDEHYYRPPQWFLENATRYDGASRQGPRVFAGEFAAQDRNRRPTLRAAIAEAAFMTGLVRNSDVIAMSSYAPLFAKADAYQWQPDMIWFDNTRVYGTASYYVQQLFSRNRCDAVVAVKTDGAAVAFTPLPDKDVATYGAKPLPPYHPASLPSVYVAAGIDRSAHETVIFLVNPYAEPRQTTLELKEVSGPGTARVTTLTSASPDDVNTFAEPSKITPRETTETVTLPTFGRTLPPYSLTVLRIALAR